MSLLNNLPHKCKISRRVRSTDSLGGSKDARTVEQTGVECWEQQASASEVKDYEKRGIRISTKIYFVADPGVSERHVITITHRFGSAVTEQEFDVKSETKPDASAGLGILWKVMCDRLTGAVQ